jgi:hypothetical protein
MLAQRPLFTAPSAPRKSQFVEVRGIQSVTVRAYRILQYVNQRTILVARSD